MTDDIEHYITRRGVDIITCKFPAGSRELWLPVVRVRRADHTHTCTHLTKKVNVQVF